MGARRDAGGRQRGWGAVRSAGASLPAATVGTRLCILAARVASVGGHSVLR